ncbi:MAG: hypothetical protein ACO3XJ_06400 [Candidatus Nanopelagicales bacterium]
MSKTKLDDQPITKRQRLLMLVPVIVLIAVALNEPRLYHQENLTSWKGGGFGMFATIDKHSWRPVVVKLTFTDRDGGNEKVIQVDIRSYLDAIKNDADKSQHLEDTRSLPTQHNLGVLANQLAEFKYITDQGDFAFVSTQGFGVPISPRQISIELYRVIYDDPTNRGTYELITTWNSRNS